MTHNIIVMGRVTCPECFGRLFRTFGLGIAKQTVEVSSLDTFCEFCG
jgi:hypothetical protein